MDIKIIAQTDWEKWRVKTFYTKEPETLAWIDDFKSDAVFWDIGANIGIYSLYCAYKHPEMLIHAFEPLRSNYLRLWQNIWKNEFTNIVAHYMAIGNENGIKWFTANSAETGSSGGQVRNEAGTGINYQITARSGDYMSRSIGAPNYVKIDTDGNEYDIILGMYETLNILPHVRSILIEENLFVEEINEIMESAGFAPDDKYNSLKTRESDHNVIFTRF